MYRQSSSATVRGIPPCLREKEPGARRGTQPLRLKRLLTTCGVAKRVFDIWLTRQTNLTGDAGTLLCDGDAPHLLTAMDIPRLTVEPLECLVFADIVQPVSATCVPHSR
jgi:hypothetical protein